MGDLILIIITVVIVLVVCYIGAIYLVKITCQKTMDEAKKSVDDFLQKIIDAFQSKPMQTFQYNVAIGSNGIAIRDDIVHTYFEKLNTLFETWSYERSYFSSENIVCYEFRVYDCTLCNPTKKRITDKVRPIAEKALTMHFHGQGIYNIVVDGFVAIRLYSDRLFVYYATNDKGFEEIKAIRQQPK